MGKPLGHPSNPCEIMSRMSPGTLQELVADVVAAGTRQAPRQPTFTERGLSCWDRGTPTPPPHPQPLEIAVQPPLRHAGLVVNAALKP